MCKGIAEHCKVWQHCSCIPPCEQFSHRFRTLIAVPWDSVRPRELPLLKSAAEKVGSWCPSYCIVSQQLVPYSVEYHSPIKDVSRYVILIIS